MKSPCCAFLFVLLLIVLGLQGYTIHLLKMPSISPAPITYVTPSLTPTPIPNPTSTPAPSPAVDESKLLFERNNVAGCGYTDTAPFTLSGDHLITKLQTWYSWSSGESSLAYVVKKGEETVYQGTFVRKSCDPYQQQWCQAIDESVNKNLAKGDYQIVAANKRICQNSGSESKGFVYVYGM